MMDSRAMERIITVCLLIFIGFFSVANAQTPFCSGGLCFIRLDPNSANTWSAAQQRCKENNATLPIVDNPDHQKSFLDALSHLQIETTMGVWLGANASDDGPDNWRWLNGDRYTGTDVQGRGEYYKSYAYVAKKETEVKAYAAPPNSSYSYICQYISPTPDVCTNGTGLTAFVRDNNRCYMKYDEKLPWFSARNKCLENNGDLASFSQLSLLDGIVDSSGIWVGLRHSHWDWRNEVTGQSFDVTYTSWQNGQPNDAAPHCISTDTDDNFSNWRDLDCTNSYAYIICQVSDGSKSSLPVTIPNTPSSSSFRTSSTFSTTTSRTTTASSKAAPPMGTPESTRTNASTISASESNVKSNNDGHVNNSLAIGLGVGLGVPFLIIIVVIIVVVAVVLRRRRRKRKLNNKSGDSNVLESKEQKLNSHTTMPQAVGNVEEGNVQYEKLQIQSRLQDQSEYEQLGREQSPYERV